MENIIHYSQFINESSMLPEVADLIDQEKKIIETYDDVMRKMPELRTQESQLAAHLIEAIGAFHDKLGRFRRNEDDEVLADIRSLSNLNWDDHTLEWFVREYEELLNKINVGESM